MILFKRIYKKQIYFVDKPSFKYGLFVEFILTESTKNYFGFSRISKYSKLIDLSKDYISNIDKQTLYESNRAIKENCYTKNIENLDIYLDIDDKFCKEKGRGGGVSKLIIEKNLNSIVIRGGYNSSGELLVAHSYLIDSEIKRVMLWRSSSIMHGEISNQKKNEVGRVNRMLHIDDFEYFKKIGYKIYDFGGYAFNTSDIQLIGINKFKDCFGGVLIESSNYVSEIMILANKFKKALNLKRR